MAILDWMMPGIDGIDICRRIRSLQPDPYRYVLLLSAKDDKQDVVQGLEAGADDYLTKPFDVDELHARVRAGNGFWNCRMSSSEPGNHYGLKLYTIT